jgi:hypothetical protein
MNTYMKEGLIHIGLKASDPESANASANRHGASGIRLNAERRQKVRVYNIVWRQPPRVFFRLTN